MKTSKWICFILVLLHVSSLCSSQIVVKLTNPIQPRRVFYTTVFLMRSVEATNSQWPKSNTDSTRAIIKEIKIPYQIDAKTGFFPFRFLYKKENNGYSLTFDINDNQAFDDSTFHFTTRASFDLIEAIRVERRIEGFPNHPFVFYIQPNVKSCNYELDNKDEEANKLCIQINFYKEGQLTLNGNRYSFYVKNTGFDDNVLYDRKHTKVLFYDPADESKPVSEENTIPYRLGDTITLLGKYFKLADISKLGDSLVLTQIKSKRENIGINVGQKAPMFYAKSISSEAILSAKQLNNKYTLLDFWGTWCKPCIDIIPVLKRGLAEVDTRKVNMYSIAFENLDVNKDSLLNFASKHGVAGNVIMEYDRKSEINALNKIFKVRAYPTLLLINPSGRIVFREEGLAAPEKLFTKMKALGIL